MALADLDTSGLADLVIASPVDGVATGIPVDVVNVVLGRLVCPFDVNCDGSVDALDVAAATATAGACPLGGVCRADVTGDGLVTVLDLVLIGAAVTAGTICP
jgi:hypothetical protein